jgi:phage terminase large subunit GpA-like protein
MDRVTDPRVQVIVFKASAQVSKTEGLINNTVGYFIHADPSPIMVVQPTLDLAELWSKERLAPMLRDTPVLKNLVEDPRTRDSGNTVLSKSFTGGHVSIVGANSPVGLASQPIRVLALDEVDRFPAQVGTEGDPVSLATKRTTTFPDRKILMASTPTIKDHSRIDDAYEHSDKNRYHVPCPDCGTFQPLEWKSLSWADRPPEQAFYICRECGVVIEQSSKTAMIDAGKWIPEAPFSDTAGYWINELYSPWVTWGEMAANFLKAKQKPETLQVFVNTSLAECWEEQGEGITLKDISERGEVYDFEIPDGVLILVAGIDTQDDRLEVEIVGYGKDEERWSIDYRTLRGDPAKAVVWADLSDLLTREFEGRDGRIHRIAAAAIDSGGHHTQTVYKFCKANKGRRWFAVKGSNTPGRPIASRPQKSGRQKIDLFLIGTETAKDEIAARIKIQDPGPGYWHFPAHYDEEYYRQLCAEKAVTKFHRGFPTRQWHKVRSRNEALDCAVYARAALEILNPDWKTIIKKAGQARRIQITDDTEETPAPAEAAASEPESPGTKPEPQEREQNIRIGRRIRRKPGRGWRL